MISLIIYSTDAARFAAASAAFGAALAGEPIEVIGVHDGPCAADGYNRAVAASGGEIVILARDGVEILSPNLFARLSSHLARFDLIGVAGTDCLINAVWTSAGPPHIFGQVAHLHPDGKIVADIYNAPRPAVGNIQAIDGLFMAARRSVFEKVRFDAVMFDGLHLYDMDLSFQAYHAGLRLGVASDIVLLHQFVRKQDPSVQIYAQRFAAKWGGRLPDVLPPQLFRWPAMVADSRAHALEIMSPAYWND